jgi:hypothetical protein
MHPPQKDSDEQKKLVNYLLLARCCGAGYAGSAAAGIYGRWAWKSEKPVGRTFIRHQDRTNATRQASRRP